MIPRTTLLILRLFVGLTWLFTGWNKITNDGGWASAMVESIDAMKEQAYPFYRSFIDAVVLPNSEVFASLVTWGEFAVGVSLFFGIAARFGAGVGAFLSLNYALLQGRHLYLPGLDGTLFWAQLVLLMGAAGRALGVDRYLHRRWPGILLW